MAHTLERKKQDIETLRKSLDENDTFIFANPIGLTVAQSSALRRKLRAQGCGMKVYKNTLIKLVLKDRGNGQFEPLTSGLKGPTAVAVSKDPIVLSKLLLDYARENDVFKVGGGCYAGQTLSPAEVVSLSRLGSREEVVSKLILALKAPMYKLVNALKGPATSLTLTLKAMAEEKKLGEPGCGTPE